MLLNICGRRTNLNLLLLLLNLLVSYSTIISIKHNGFRIHLNCYLLLVVVTGFNYISGRLRLLYWLVGLLIRPIVSLRLHQFICHHGRLGKVAVLVDEGAGIHGIVFVVVTLIIKAQLLITTSPSWWLVRWLLIGVRIIINSFTSIFIHHFVYKLIGIFYLPVATKAKLLSIFD